MATKIETLSKYPDVLTVKQVGAIIHVCDKTVYKMIHEEQLFALQVGRKFRIPKQAVLALMEICSHEKSLE